MENHLANIIFITGFLVITLASKQIGGLYTKAGCPL